MKKIILLIVTIICVVLLILLIDNIVNNNLNFISKNIEITNYGCEIKSEKDTHGGFLGDGDYFAKISCSKINYDELSSNWKELPITDTLNSIMEMIQCNEKACKSAYERYSIPNIVNGYYYFIDRHSESTNKYDDTNINTRSSFNFTLALLDKDTNIIYYYELDT